MARTTSSSAAAAAVAAVNASIAKPPSTPLPSLTLSSGAQREALEALDKDIEAIAQELQDQIFDTALLASLPPLRKPRPKMNPPEKMEEVIVTTNDDPAGRICIDREYKPPLFLQINRKLREKFARFY